MHTCAPEVREPPENLGFDPDAKSPASAPSHKGRVMGRGVSVVR